MSDDELLLQTPRFNVVRRKYVTPAGPSHQREIIEHPGAVAIIPMFDDGRICLIENFRVAVGRSLIEIPAGTRDPGEDPAATAGRELREETGYKALHFQQLTEFWMSPGILSERMHLYLATGLTLGERDLDEGEQITNRIVSWEEAIDLVRTGQIEDAKSIVGLLFYERFVLRGAP